MKILNKRNEVIFEDSAQAARATNHPLADKLLIPSDPVRNGDNQIIGCRAFSVV